MNTTKTIISIPEKYPIEDNKKVATRLIWIPGKRPVIVPAATPINKAKRICINIKFKTYINTKKYMF
jgi:hypothetical protein